MIKWNAAAASLGTVLALLALSAAPARAEEVEKKFRVGVALGGYNTQSEIDSDSANTLIIADDQENFVDAFRDPRNDSAAIGTLGIRSMYSAAVNASYAFTRYFVVEGSVGYHKGDLGDIELQAQFAQQDIPADQEFNMMIARFPAGEVEEVPVQLTAMYRFRPKAQLSPYLGAGVGYIFVGYEPSAEINALSTNMDASTGGFAPLIGEFGSRDFSPAPSVGDLKGATVEASDSFEWHAAGGMEYAFKKGWAAFVDLRYIFASRSLEVKFNGAHDFGHSVPDTVYYGADPRIFTDQYGPIQIVQGGLIDAGQLVPRSPDTDCAINPTDCDFVAQPDGQLDPGYYYVKGGAIKYGGFALQLGIKYTF